MYTTSSFIIVSSSNITCHITTSHTTIYTMSDTLGCNVCQLLTSLMSCVLSCVLCLILCLSVTEAEAKDVHRSLKMAAGIFKHLKVMTASSNIYSKAIPVIASISYGYNNDSLAIAFISLFYSKIG